MRKALTGLLATLFLLTTGGVSMAHEGHQHDKHHDNHHLPKPSLPAVPVEVKNQSDVFVSLTISSSCVPRLILAPGKSVTIANCLERGLVYHVRAVFYTPIRILESYDFLFTVKPDAPWIFCKLP